MEAKELIIRMQQYTGTMSYHKLTLTSLLATDGILMIAEKAGAYWLIDAIGSYQANPKVKSLLIQFWTLEVKDNTAVLYCVEDFGMPRIIEQQIDYTNFPEGSWKFYVQNGIMMLPGEY